MNGMNHGPMPFHMIAGQLWVTPQVLRELGLKVNLPVTVAGSSGEPLLLLEQQFGQDVTYNVGMQSLSIMVGVEKLDVGTHRLGTADQNQPVAQNAEGMLLNYDVYVIESFNGEFRAECLNQHWFMSLDDAVRKCEAWRRDYNEARPHSAIGKKAPPISLMLASAAHGPP